MNISTSVDDSKTSAQIVDELFKELQTKSLDIKPTEEILESTLSNVNSTIINSPKKSHKRKKRSRSRGETSGESSSDDSKRHRHHKRRKKRKSESESRKRHKHKHSRSRKNRDKDGKTRHKLEDDGNEVVEWESDTGNEKKIEYSDKVEVDKDLQSGENIVKIVISENVLEKSEKSVNLENNGDGVVEIEGLKDCVVSGNDKNDVKDKESEGGSTGDSEGDVDSATKKDKSPKKHRKKRKSYHKDSKEYSRDKDKKRSVSPRNDQRRRKRSNSSSRHSRSRQDRDDWRSSSRRHPTRSESNSTERNRRSRSPRRDTHVDTEKIDKAKLLEIARKNAMVMFNQGRVVMPGVRTENVQQQQMVALRSGGKSVAELTNFCKQLVNKDDATSSEGESTNVASDEESGPFIQHPFKLKDPQPNIVMNIKNAVQVPVKTPAEKAAESAKLRIQFPVSSGSQHRKKESEWVPVIPPKEPVQKNVAAAVVTSNVAVVVEEKVFPESNPQTARSIDIGNVVSQRLKAVKKLQENPHDVEALNVIYHVQQQAQSWAESKQLPGQFTGSTNARLLTPEELAGPAHLQAWVKKDQFNRAPPVDGGMGMYLLRKMGWNPGEGLGKHKEGVTVPLMLDIKMDKKGLTSAEETARKIPSVPALKDLSGKHPVSALVELCSKRKWSPPDFNLVHDSGPDHKKNFLFQVRINNVDYQPTIASTNKKHAKAQAATVCLQALGLYPRDLNNPL